MLGDARLFFAGELTDLLTCAHVAGSLRYPVDRSASIKDVIEAIGIPHTEVYAIRSGGRTQDFSLQLSPGMTAAFLPANLTTEYPVDVTAPSLLRPPLSRLAFVVDENVAGLVPLLRALGIDAAYDRTWDDQYIARLAEEEQRVVLTRDRALLKRSRVHHGRLIRTQNVDGQLLEVLNHFVIRDAASPFTRCLRCNVLTSPVNKADILDRLEPKTRIHYHSFRQCPACDRLFWRGSHHEKLVARFRSLGIDWVNFDAETDAKTG